jgi:glycosyltransferase involved in cell wall biosynthesis
VKILMITQFFAPVIGGEERVVENLSMELQRRGHQVAVATLQVSGSPEYEVYRGIRVHRIRSLASRAGWLFSDPERRHVPPAPDPEAMLGLKRVLERERPDIVHAHNWLVHSFLPLKRWSRARLVVSLHDFSLVCATKRLMYEGISPCTGPGPVKCLACSRRVYGGLKGPTTTVLNWAAGLAERRVVDMFLPISDAVARRSGLVGVGLPFRVVPNFVPEAGAETSRNGDHWMSQLPAGEFLLYAGDVTLDKGAGVLLDAYAQLENAPPLVLIGRADPRVLTPQRLNENVIVLGPWPHEALTQARRRCAVAIVPSVWDEPFGMVALEAMAEGRPVIASNVGGLAELVVGGESGLLVPRRDRSALRAALEALLSDRALRDDMGQAARRRVQAFSARRIVPLVEQAYQDTL